MGSDASRQPERNVWVATPCAGDGYRCKPGDEGAARRAVNAHAGGVSGRVEVARVLGAVPKGRLRNRLDAVGGVRGAAERSPNSAHFATASFRSDSTNRRSLGASRSARSSDGALHTSAVCSWQTGVPAMDAVRKTILKDEPGSCSVSASDPTASTSTPNSSRNSRLAASRSDSPGSIFPPGNSQRPPCRLCSGRWQTSRRSPSEMTAAMTRMVFEGTAGSWAPPGVHARRCCTWSL